MFTVADCVTPPAKKPRVYAEPKSIERTYTGLPIGYHKKKKTDAPEGYKPIRHRPCGRTLAWVKEEVCAGMAMRHKDILTLNRDQLQFGDPLPRCECLNGRMVNPGDLRISTP